MRLGQCIKKEDMYQSTPNWSFCKTKNPQEYLKGTEELSSQSCASKGQQATSTGVQGRFAWVSPRGLTLATFMSPPQCALRRFNGRMDPELLPLVQPEVILHFQSLRCSEVHLVECVLQSWSCTSLSAMHQPVSISFPFNPGAQLTLPCSTHKSRVSTPRLHFPAVFPAKPGSAAKRHKIWSWQRSPRPAVLRPKQPGTTH